MPTLSVRAVDATTGTPIADAAVFVTVSPPTAPVTSGFTNARGDFLTVVSKQLLKTYTIRISAKGYTDVSGNRTIIGNQTIYYTGSMTPTLPPPPDTTFTYPVVVGVGTAPDLVLTNPGPEYDDIIVSVAGTYPSTSRSPVPASGPVVIPMVHRLVVGPPSTLQLISHAERIRPASDLAEVYTITIQGRMGTKRVPIGVLTTTAILAEVGSLDTYLQATPWLTPWPAPSPTSTGLIPIERGGYTEIIAVVPRGAAVIQYNLFSTGADDDPDGRTTTQGLNTFLVQPGAGSFLPHRIRVPDTMGRFVRLQLLQPGQNTGPFAQFAVRSIH